MKNLILAISCMLLVCSTQAQGIYTIETPSNQTTEFAGDLATGQFIEDLSWAWNSSVACFPETQAKKFTGKHVFYIADLPKYSEMEVTVIPDDEDANFSIYAYEVGTVTDDNLVPNLTSCIRCEADHKWDRNYVGKTQDHSRMVKNLVAINNPYQVLIAVVGAEGLTEGTFRLQVNLKSR